MIGRGDDDGIDIAAREHFTVVAGGEYLVAVDLAGAGEAAVVDVADGGKFDAGLGEGEFGVAHAHTAETDGGDADPVVGRRLLLRGARESGAEDR